MKTPTIKDIRAAAAARQTRRRWRNRLTWGIGVTLVVGGVLAFFVVPKVVRTQLETRLGEVFGPGVSMGAVTVSLTQLAITVDDMSITDPEGNRLLAWDRLKVNARGWALLRGRAGFDVIELDGFRGNVAIDAQGKLNFARILAGRDAPASKAAEDSVPLIWEIGRLTVNEARIDFADQSRTTPFATAIGPLSFSLQSFHTRGDPQAPYRFDAVTEVGEGVSWNGTLSLTPLRSQGTVELTGVQLPKYAPYYASAVNFDLSSGEVSGRADYDFDFSGNAPVIEVRSALMQLQGLALHNRGSREPSISADLIKLSDIVYAGEARSLVVGQLEWVGGQVAATRDADGVDLQRWGGAAERGGAEAPTGPNASPGLAVKLGHLQSDGLRLKWQDLTLPQPTAPVIATLTVDLSDLDLAHLDRAATGEVRANFASGGTVAVSGSVAPSPFAPKLKIETKALSLSPISPYLESAMRGRLEGGTLTLAGSLDPRGDGLVFRGDAEMGNVKLATTEGAQIAGWENLRINGVHYVSSPAALTVESVRWIRPEGRLHIRRDGTLNWSSLGVEAESSADPTVAFEAPPVAAESTDAMELRVDRLELVGAHLDFEDESLPRAARLKLMDLSGTLLGLSSTEIGQAQAELAGKVDGVAPVKISGDFNPLGRPAYTNLKMNFDRIDLRSLGGYASKYAGYNLDRGRLSLVVDFALKDRVIKSSTVATLDDFELGAKYDSDEATKLPVKLAVALLKDRAGQIVIDLPVEGDLDDPEFRFGRVIGRVLVNLLTRAATSPFALLGAAVGGDEDVLESHPFTAGKGGLTGEMVHKLDTVARALAARPELKVTIEGEYDATSDREALKPEILDRQLRAAAGLDAAAEVPWTEKTRTDALIQRYLQVFGVPPIDAGKVVTLERPRAAVQSPPAGPAAAADESGGLLELIRRLLGKSGREGGSDTRDAGGASMTAPVADVPPTRVEYGILPADVIAAQLLEEIEVTPADLEALARARAVAVHTHLAAQGVAPARMALNEPKAGQARVELNLE